MTPPSRTPPVPQEAPRRRHSIATELRGLLLLALLPFVVLIATFGWLAYRDAREAAEALVRHEAARVAHEAGREIAEAQRVLAALAARASLRRMEPAGCAAELRDLAAIQPRYSNIFVADPGGSVVCASEPPPGGARSFTIAERDWLRAVAGGERFAVGAPTRGPITGQWVTPVGAPILDADGKPVGAIGLSMRLTTWEPPGGRDVVPEDLSMGLVDENGVIAWRHPEPERWVGRNVAGTAIFDEVRPAPERVFDAEGWLGMQRIWAVKPVAGARWVAYAGIGRGAALGSTLTKTGLALALVTLGMFIAAGLAIHGARHLTRPIDAIARAARARATGADELVPVDGPSEIAEVARELNRMIRARQQDERRLRTLSRAVEQSPESIIITDSAGLIEYVNPRFEEVSGYAAAEVIGRNPRLLQSGRTARDVYASLWKTITDGGMWRGTLCNRRKNGEVYWEHAAISGLMDEQRRITHYVAVKSDITAQMRADAALRESERRFTTVFQASPIGICVTRLADGSILSVNDAALRLFGRERADVLGQSPDALGIDPDPVRRDELIRKLREEGRVDRFLVEVRKACNEVGLVEIAACRIELQGEPAAVAMILDVTDRKRLEEARLRSQKLESLGTLAGGIAHDFNNLLSAIRGNAELAAEDVGPGHPAMASLEEIRKAGRRASELVRRITAFGQPKEARHESLNLQTVVGEVLELLRSTLPAGIEMRTRFAESLPPVLADAAQVHEAVVNLATNAAYAIGGKPGTIEYLIAPAAVAEEEGAVLGIAPGAYVRLTVRDTGCGMDAQTRERIFDAFFTTKPAGEGSGLGLSMVYGIMQAHGGAVSVESEPGTGSSFHLYFPAAPGARALPVEAPAASVAAPPGCRVMYVDDEESLVMLARRSLQRLGHHVDGFTDPRVALEVFRRAPHDYDAVVTDLSMPRLSGLDVAREVLAARPDIPVVMMTGYLRPGDEEKAHAVGIRDVVVKASTVQELAGALDRVLRAPEHGRRAAAD